MIDTLVAEMSNNEAVAQLHDWVTLVDDHGGAADGSCCMVLHLLHAQSGAAFKQHMAHLLVNQAPSMLYGCMQLSFLPLLCS